MECSVRIATIKDLPEIFRLEQECFAVPWSLKSLETDLTRNSDVATYLVAEQDGRIAGYIGMWAALDTAQVTNLAVSAEYRNRGIGCRLILELCRIAGERNISSLTLEVRPSNVAARKVYIRAGFEEISIRKGYYPNNGEDAIIMLKNISQGSN